jgi:hypothetical protein
MGLLASLRGAIKGHIGDGDDHHRGCIEHERSIQLPRSSTKNGSRSTSSTSSTSSGDSCNRDSAVDGSRNGDTGMGATARTEAAAASPPRKVRSLVLVLDEAAPMIDDPDAGWLDLAKENGVVILLGDNRGLNAEEEEGLVKMEQEGVATVVKVSLGPTPLLASQCIVLVHHYLDRLAHCCRPREQVTRILQHQFDLNLANMPSLPLSPSARTPALAHARTHTRMCAHARTLRAAGRHVSTDLCILNPKKNETVASPQQARNSWGEDSRWAAWSAVQACGPVQRVVSEFKFRFEFRFEFRQPVAEATTVGMQMGALEGLR